MTRVPQVKRRPHKRLSDPLSGLEWLQLGLLVVRTTPSWLFRKSKQHRGKLLASVIVLAFIGPGIATKGPRPTGGIRVITSVSGDSAKEEHSCTHFVDSASTGGDGTEGDPWEADSIFDASSFPSAVGLGDSVCVNGGTYVVPTSDWTMSASGQGWHPDSVIWVINTPNERPVIALGLHQSGGADADFYVQSDYVIFHGIEISIDTTALLDTNLTIKFSLDAGNDPVQSDTGKYLIGATSGDSGFAFVHGAVDGQDYITVIPATADDTFNVGETIFFRGGTGDGDGTTLSVVSKRFSSRVCYGTGSLCQQAGMNSSSTSMYPASEGKGLAWVYGMFHDAAGSHAQQSGSHDYLEYAGISYNNGWQGKDRTHGHCAYTQHHPDSGYKHIRANIFHTCFNTGWQLFETGSFMSNIGGHFNIVLHGPTYGTKDPGGEVMEFTSSSANMGYDTLANNALMRRGSHSGTAITHETNDATNIVMRENYIAGRVYAESTKTSPQLFVKNVHMGSDSVLGYGMMRMVRPNHPHFTGVTVDSNTYHNLADTTSDPEPFQLITPGGTVNLRFSEWQDTTGQDQNSTYTADGWPGDTVLVMPADTLTVDGVQVGELGRVNIAALCWAGSDSLEIVASRLERFYRTAAEAVSEGREADSVFAYNRLSDPRMLSPVKAMQWDGSTSLWLGCQVDTIPAPLGGVIKDAQLTSPKEKNVYTLRRVRVP